jgi:hypothetical protein
VDKALDARFRAKAGTGLRFTGLDRVATGTIQSSGLMNQGLLLRFTVI